MKKTCALLALGVVLAGCGGDDKKTDAPAAAGGDQAQVEATFRTYLDRLAAKDGAGACAQMSPSLQKDMLAAMRKAGAGALVEGKSCGQVLDFIAEQSPAYNQAATALKDAEIADVKIDGDTATYDWSLKLGGKTTENKGEAVRSGDKWLVSCCVPGQ